MNSSFCLRCKRLCKTSVLDRHDGLCPRCARDEEEPDEDVEERLRRGRKLEKSQAGASGDPVSRWLWIILGVEALGAVVLFLVMQAREAQDPILGIYFFTLITAGWLASRVVFHIASGGQEPLDRFEIFLGMVATIFRRPQILLTFVLAVAFFAAGMAFVNPPPRASRGAKQEQQQQQSLTPEEQGSSAPGLRAHWSFDEGRGDKAVDSGPHRLEARLRGCQWVPGVRGTALQFNGTSDQVDLSDSNVLSFSENAPFTIAAWVKTASFEGHVLSFRIAQDRTFDLLNIFSSSAEN